MRLGDVANAGAADHGRPMDGVRVLALEQMQSLPFATQLLARLGADVVKIEHPRDGESGRQALPAMADPHGRRVGATFLRNNLNKRSVGIDVKSPEGRELVFELAGRFDVLAENFRAGALDRMGLGYQDVSGRHPTIIYASISGFGSAVPSPYQDWPAYAAITEAMSGIYEYQRRGDEPPVVGPVGALGDIGTALFAAVGILAALRHRDRTGQGQHLDVAMFDAMVAMTDVVTNFWSLGQRGGAGDLTVIMDGFRAGDGWIVIQVARDHQFLKLVELIGEPGLAADPRFAERAGWRTHLDAVLRPAIERWASSRTMVQACEELARTGIPAGPCFAADDLVHDPHVAGHHMLIEVPRTDGVAEPVLVPGNPIKLSKMAEGPETRVPWVGEHTDVVLKAELGLDDPVLADLRDRGVIS
jgi:crotonobetainyl-CoA:carnitine CoA-transferase CaiB-like acyl-CoA transferase